MARRKGKERLQPPVGLSLLPLPDTQTDPATEAKKAIREILSWVAIFVGAVLIAALSQQFVFSLLRVDGQSMRETLLNNEFVFISKAAYWHTDPRRLDVVICRYPDRADTYVKRVVGIPGDTVEVRRDVVLVNGRPLAEEYITYPADYQSGPVALGDGEYYVLGDNRIHSTDSHVLGPIRRDAILGRVLMVLYPFNRIRAIPAGPE